MPSKFSSVPLKFSLAKNGHKGFSMCNFTGCVTAPTLGTRGFLLTGYEINWKVRLCTDQNEERQEKRENVNLSSLLKHDGACSVRQKVYSMFYPLAQLFPLAPGVTVCITPLVPSKFSSVPLKFSWPKTRIKDSLGLGMCDFYGLCNHVNLGYPRISHDAI